MVTKIERAEKHIIELTELLAKKRPFKYVLETNPQTGENATFAEKDDTVVDEAASIAADAIHNLRSALDHAYWQIVSPFAVTPKEQRAVQFPFSETKGRLAESIKNRLANRVSDAFFDAIVSLNPYGEAGGDQMLYAVHHFDGIDKHRKPIPLGDYKQIVFDDLARQIPTFPRTFSGNGSFGMNRRDIVWHIAPMPWWPGGVIKTELNVPISVVLNIGTGVFVPMVPAIERMRDAAVHAIKVMRSV